MASVVDIDGEQMVESLHNLSLQDQDGEQTKTEINELGFGHHGGCCAICLDKIVLQETAMVKGCEHAYCVTCILRWASYKEKPTCPQCKHPFEFLNVHRALDGSISDFMFEESVCLLLRATWFKPLFAEDHVVELYEDPDNHYLPCEYEDDDEEDFYLGGSGIRLGNRRWGDNGFVRSGRQEARPVHHRPKNNQASSSASSSREPKNKEAATGRRAKRAMKREAANRAAEAAAAAKHQEHLVRLGRK